MKNALLGVILKGLVQEYNNGTCDNLTEEDEDKLLSSLVKLKDEMEDKQDRVMTIEEASRYLNVTRLTLSNYVKEGKLHPKKHLGGVLEFKVKELKHLIKKSRKK